MVFLSVQAYRYPRMLALAHAEAGLKVYLVMEALLLNKLLKGLDYIVRTLDMA
jgi:hypothetical protein